MTVHPPYQNSQNTRRKTDYEKIIRGSVHMYHNILCTLGLWRFSLLNLSSICWGIAFSLTNARVLSCQFPICIKMTSQPSILAWTTDKKKQNLYYSDLKQIKQKLFWSYFCLMCFGNITLNEVTSTPPLHSQYSWQQVSTSTYYIWLFPVTRRSTPYTLSWGSGPIYEL